MRVVGRKPVKASRRRPKLASERRAPNRPVITHRVSQEVYDLTFAAAERANRKLTEEAGIRLEQSFVWERQWQKLQESAKKDLEARLREAGYKYIHGATGGGAWFPPEVDSVAWIFDNSNRAVLEELLERAAGRALAKMTVTERGASVSFAGEQSRGEQS